MHDAPMDMRMNEDDMFIAATVVNVYSEAELFRIIKEYVAKSCEAATKNEPRLAVPIIT